MDWITIATLVARYGIPYVEKLIANAQNKVPVTPQEWQALTALIQTPGEVLIPKRPGA